MLAEAQLFATFRWLLAIVCSVYTIIVCGQTLLGWLAYFGSSRHTAILGRYTLALILRVRAKQFAGELLQIGALLVMLAALLYAHRWLE